MEGSVTFMISKHAPCLVTDLTAELKTFRRSLWTQSSFAFYEAEIRANVKVTPP